VKMIAEWNPQPAPTWVTCVPSLRHPDLVPDFAQRLAAALDLPFHMVIAKTDARPEQKTMANSTQQARNIDGSLALNGQPILRGPVLLIDDMVDSRWTLTVSAWLLTRTAVVLCGQWPLTNGARRMTPALSPNTQAILLLTAPLLPDVEAHRPICSPGEYKRLARHLREIQHQPADLVSPDAAEILRACQPVIEEGRLQRLLGADSC
jgi:hypothetical protein